MRHAHLHERRAPSWLRGLTDPRIARALDLLEMRTTSIAQVAERVGYASELAFAKAFRRVIGVPPGTYARQHARG